MSEPLRYQPFYCEENVWWLLRSGELADAHAVFITNAHRSVALWSQRASARPDGLIMWDYHVVAIGTVDGRPTVLDPDCVAGPRLSLARWSDSTFPYAGALPADVEPRFRVVVARDLFTHFRTDRSHMRDANGDWLQPPPPWEPLAQTSNLSSYLDVDDSGPGPVMDLHALLSFWSTRHGD